MFCHKCGAQIAEGAAFCQKCGTKVVHTDDVQQPMDTTTPIAEPQSAGAVGPMIAEDTPSNHTPKENNGLHKAATIGSILMWGSLAVLALTSFLHLPIPPAIPVAGAAIGIILSTLGAKRPWGLSKILELVSAVVLLVIVVVFTLSSGGTGDKYVQLVRDGTLAAYPQMTVGEAFNGFLSNPKWESIRSDDESRFVNVTGGIIYDDEEAEIVVQFIVDEENESFQYYACEINNIPQNDLVVWGLFETIYGDPSSTGSDAQGDPDSVSDKITIGEAQSYDNEYGNIEVTLNYAAFTDKLENTLLGGYTYPDEGNVFLWADVTVNNIGTEKGSLLTAWNTLVFDGVYEFEHYTTIGDVADINPLTAPTDGALVFMVPTSVMESDKSLVLNINDGGGEAVLSYVIRPGDSISGSDTPSAPSEEAIANDLTFRGTSLTDWIGGPPDIAYDIFGWPDYGTIIDGSLYEGGECFGYNVGSDSGVTFIIDSQTNSIGWITGGSDAIEFNGIALDVTRTELIDLLGTPESEETVSDELEGTEYYAMRYTIYGASVEIALPDINSTATAIMIS